jgi:hypothetical protein
MTVEHGFADELATTVRLEGQRGPIIHIEDDASRVADRHGGRELFDPIQ